MHDIVIRGGRIADGTGSPITTGDLAIDGDRIVAVGKVDGRGTEEIDADGALVTPGWVDIHTHYDGQVTWDPEVTPSGHHGVTTAVVGNCGVGFAPVRSHEREWLIQLMEGVEDIPGTALADGMTWNWESFPEYLDEVERTDRILDVAAMLPHGALRAFVLGCDRNNDDPTSDEIAAMEVIAREAIVAGAVGISTTRTLGHVAKDGQPAAGTFAPAAELLAMGAAMRGAGRRVFSMASEHTYQPDGAAEAEFTWMAELSRANGIPVTYMCMDIPPEYGDWRYALRRGLEANHDGTWLVPQVPGKPTCVMVGWESTYHLFSGQAAYQPLVDLPVDERINALRTPEVRAAILGEPPALGNPQVARLHADLANLYPLGDPPDYEPGPDASVAALAASQGRDPLEVAYDLMMGRNGRELLYSPFLGYTLRNLDALRELLVHPSTVPGLADGGAHVGYICDGTTPTFMLSHWARDRSRGDRIPLEQVVHLQTLRTASLFGFEDRGRLAPGLLADVNVIDDEHLALGPVEFVYDLPSGAKRLMQKATGYLATVKSGRVVRRRDGSTGELPGRLLRGPVRA